MEVSSKYVLDAGNTNVGKMRPLKEEHEAKQPLKLLTERSRVRCSDRGGMCVRKLWEVLRAPVEHRLGLTQSDVAGDQQHEGKVTPKAESHCFSQNP